MCVFYGKCTQTGSRTLQENERNPQLIEIKWHKVNGKTLFFRCEPSDSTEKDFNGYLEGDWFFRSNELIALFKEKLQIIDHEVDVVIVR